ncbi:MAG TPA: T9SS type A sorting domain-containing protein [Bacteroidales bacterium]|nr:T9SS type A sorting domain-containing protein [Bacteroidales bacterium]
MKKIYTTLMLVLIASISFAQISTVTVKEGQTRIPIQKRTENKLERAGAGSWWFSYCDDLQYYMGQELEYGYVTFLQDSVATIEYTSGDGRPQFYSFVQIFDFTEQIWFDLYNGLMTEEGTPIPVPHIGTTASYDIDSMSCIFAYEWGTNVDINNVDTLVMTIIATSSMEYQNLTSGGVTAFKQAKLDYNINDATIAPAAHPKFYQVKYPLTINDTTGGYFMYKNLPVVGFDNLTHKTVAVAFSFKSGTPNRTIASVIGTDLNRFVAYYNEDPRSEYNTNGTTALTSEKSNSMNAMEWSVADPEYFLYGKYIHNKVWTGNLKRPGLSVYATCNDCEWVGVNEADQKNIAVRPNPATDNFTVTLVDNSTATIQLFNIVGQMVSSQITNELTATVNVADLTAGIYMLKVSQNGKTYTSKVVVK